MTESNDAGSQARVEFCGETYPLDPTRNFVIGREGDLVIDSNPFLHRRFLELTFADNLWWLGNIGSQLQVTAADGTGSMHAWLSPGAKIPASLFSPRSLVHSSPTTYEFEILLGSAPYEAVASSTQGSTDGTTTMNQVPLTPDQLRIVLALSEATLMRGPHMTSKIPGSAEAAKRLGWTLTKFNRKLDTVCEKLGRAGVRGLHGDADKLAVNRRARLVEYALSTQLVSRDDLLLLDDLAGQPEVDGDEEAAPE